MSNLVLPCFRDNELIVTVQGPRPDNILFLVHEVFEGLIAESFHGVTYDFSLPCPQCQNMVSVISSTGQRPASYCHGLVSVVCASVCSSMHVCIC